MRFAPSTITRAIALTLSSTLPLGITSQPTHAQKVHFTVHGDATLHELGSDVRSAGDVNGDGLDDLIVGIPGDPLLGQEAGAARVYSGLDGAILHTLRGDAAQQRFGASVAGLGDVNGDGRSDLVVGLPSAHGGAASSGRARVVSGLDGSVLYEWQGLVTSENFGGSVARCDDLDGDLVPDVLVGADNAATPNGRAGRVLVYSGATGLLIRQLTGPAHNVRFGRSVRCAGDVDGDGVSDIVIGAPWADPNGNNSGSAYVHSGATGLVLRQFDGSQANNELGHSVDGGDVDSDGRADIIVGTLAGNYVRVYSGATGQLLFAPTSAMPEHFGRSVAYLGDMDGDGLGDVAIGDRLGLLRGEAHVYAGDGRGMFVFATTFDQDHFGQAVAAAGDVDGDGRADLVVGAPRADLHGASSGMARVFLGSQRIGVTYCNPAQPTTTGPPARIVAYGSVVASENCVTLSAFGIPRLAFGYFIGSQSQGVFQPGGSNGFICVSGPNAARFNQAGSIIQGPLGMLQLDLTAIPGNPVQVAFAGQTWNFQCWFRDGVSSNFTDAVSLAFL